jgi:hypothetical protein
MANSQDVEVSQRRRLLVQLIRDSLPGHLRRGARVARLLEKAGVGGAPVVREVLVERVTFLAVCRRFPKAAGRRSPCLAPHY